MSRIEFRLSDYLKADTTLTSLVGTAVYPVRVPRVSQEPRETPAITYRRKSGGRTQNLDGAAGHPMAVFELTVWSRVYDDAKAIAEAIRNRMDGFKGSFTDINVLIAYNTDEKDDFFSPIDGSDEGWFAVVLDFAVRYIETVPTFS